MTELLKNVLVQRLGYTSERAALIGNELGQLSQELLPILDLWLVTEEESVDEEHGGYSISSLKENYDMDFIASLLTLDWIIKEPEDAVYALREGVM